MGAPAAFLRSPDQLAASHLVQKRLSLGRSRCDGPAAEPSARRLALLHEVCADQRSAIDAAEAAAADLDREKLKLDDIRLLSLSSLICGRKVAAKKQRGFVREFSGFVHGDKPAEGRQKVVQKVNAWDSKVLKEVMDLLGVDRSAATKPTSPRRLCRCWCASAH